MEGLLFHTPLLLLAAAITLFSVLLLTERFAQPEDIRRPRPDSRLIDPYIALPSSPVALAPVRGLPPMPPLRDFLRDHSGSDRFPPDMDPVERLMRHAALLGDRKTAWLSIDEPVALLRRALATGHFPRGPLMPRTQHLAMLAERVHGPALVAFDNRLGAWTIVLPMREPYETLQQIALDTNITLGNILGDDHDRSRRILELYINPESPEAKDLPFSGNLFLITHEGLGALYISNSMFEGRRFLSGLARGHHAVPLGNLPNEEVLQWPLDFAEDWRTDGLIESRFLLLAPAAAANTSANSQALRLGEWLLGVSQWDTLRGTATIAGDGSVQWRVQADTVNEGTHNAAIAGLLGVADARPLLAHLPVGAEHAVAVQLASLTSAYDQWRDHLVGMGFPDGAEGIARAERDLAMTLGFWIRESLIPLLGDRLAIGLYGTGADETWVVVADTRDPRSVERMIAQASQRIDGSGIVTTPDGITLTTGTADTRARAWRISGNHLVVACGPMAVELIAQQHPVSIANAFESMMRDATDRPTPMAVYSTSLLRAFGLSTMGTFAVEEGSMVLRGSCITPLSTATFLRETATTR